MSENTLKTMAGDAAQKSYDLQQSSPSANINNFPTSKRVGPGASSAPIPAPTATPTPQVTKNPLAAPTVKPTTGATQAPTQDTTQSYNDKVVKILGDRLKANGWNVNAAGYPTPAMDYKQFIDTIKDSDYPILQDLLKKLGYSAKNKNDIRMILSGDLASVFPVNSFSELRKKLAENILPGAGTGGPDVTTYINAPTDAELKEKLKAGIFEFIKKEPKDNDPAFNNIFNTIKSLYQAGTTSTTVTDAKTGKKTVRQTGGVSQQTIDSTIKKYYNQNNQDFLESKSLDMVDYMSQWMRS